MKIQNIVTVLLITSSLASCAPAATVVPTKALVPTSTFTPIPPTATSSLTPTSIPTATPLPYMGCADPKLIAEQDSEFTERTGVVLNNPDASDEKSQKFAEALSRVTSVAYDPDKPEIQGMAVYKTGMSRVAISGIPGKSEVLCLYGRNGIILNETFSFLVGWFDENGMYHQFTFAWEWIDFNQKTTKTYEDEEQLRWAENLPDGAFLFINVHTFSGVQNLGEIRGSDDERNKGGVESVKIFLSKLKSSGNDVLARMNSSSGNIVETWAAQEPELLDMGFIPAGQWNVTPDANYEFDE